MQKNNFCRLAIGILVPAPNVVMEGEYHRMAPKGVEIFTVRLLSKDAKPTDTLSQYVKKEVKIIPETAVRIKQCNPDIIVYGCTSGSFLEGQDWNQEIVKKMKSVVDIPALTTSTAVTEALNVMGMKRIAAATPYPEDVNQKLKEYMSSMGIQIVRMGSVPYEDARSEFAAYRLTKSLNGSDIDGVFISCTDFKSVHILELLERDIEKPVISSNQAAMWACLRHGGVMDKVEGFGSLLFKSSTS